MAIIGAHDGQGDYRCNEHTDSARLSLPLYTGHDFDCTYCGRAYMAIEGEITEADVHYIGEPPHPHHVMPGTMGRMMLARRRRIREVAADRGMTVPDCQRAYAAKVRSMRVNR